MKSKLMIEPKFIAGKGLQLRRAIGIQATKKKDYLRTMLIAPSAASVLYGSAAIRSITAI
jgi:hypothetical protein